MKLSKWERAQLIRTIIEKLVELKGDGMNWRAMFFVNMVLSYLQAEEEKIKP